MVSSSKVEYIQSGQLVAANYVKNSKAIGFLWAIFSLCYAVISVVVFVQPQWIGNKESGSTGYFGLWRHCTLASVLTESSTSSTEFICRGRLDDFSSLLNPAFRAATAFVGIATLISILSVFAMILFLCAPTTVSYHIISWFHTISAICTGVGLVVFPVGLDAAEVKMTCGDYADKFNFGNCQIRWAYVLAIIGCLDGIVLAILGFVLGSRHIKLSDEFKGLGGSSRKTNSGYGYGPRGGVGSYYHHPSESNSVSYASSKRSMNLQPIVLLPPEVDAYSDFTGRSKASLYRAEYSTPSQNFQL